MSKTFNLAIEVETSDENSDDVWVWLANKLYAVNGISSIVELPDTASKLREAVDVIHGLMSWAPDNIKPEDMPSEWNAGREFLDTVIL